MTTPPVPRRPLKRILDLCITVPVLVLFLPVLVTVALGIKLEGWARGKRAPVFYRETRISRGRPFPIWKFRTVRADVDLASEQSVKLLESEANLTRVGRFLQAHYLDELPQLFNVFMGQMSLVGPRPVDPRIYEIEVGAGVDLRSWIPAGLTGQFQVQKGVGDFRERRVALDQAYFDKYRSCGNLGLVAHDLRLLGRTFKTLVRGGGW